MIIYCGTFNPIHNGHIKIAKTVEELFKDTVLFIPAYDSPWKPELKETFLHRCKMLDLADLKYLTIEKELPTPSYTFQTILALYAGERIKFIIGTDQFLQLYKWKNSNELKKRCEFLVINRNCNDETINLRVALDFQQDLNYQIIPMELIDISSTEVRKGNLDLVPFKVKEYILKNNLY